MAEKMFSLMTPHGPSELHVFPQSLQVVVFVYFENTIAEVVSAVHKHNNYQSFIGVQELYVCGSVVCYMYFHHATLQELHFWDGGPVFSKQQKVGAALKALTLHFARPSSTNLFSDLIFWSFSPVHGTQPKRTIRARILSKKMENIK